MGQCYSKSSVDDDLATKNKDAVPDAPGLNRKTSATSATVLEGESEFTVKNSTPQLGVTTLGSVVSGGFGDGGSTIGPSVQTIKASNCETVVNRRQDKRLDQLLCKNYNEHHDLNDADPWNCVGSRISALDQVDEGDDEEIPLGGFADVAKEDDPEEALFAAVHDAMFNNNTTRSRISGTRSVGPGVKRDRPSPPARVNSTRSSRSGYKNHNYKDSHAKKVQNVNVVNDVDAALFAAMEEAHDAKFNRTKRITTPWKDRKRSKGRSSKVDDEADEEISLEYFFGVPSSPSSGDSSSNSSSNGNDNKNKRETTTATATATSSWNTGTSLTKQPQQIESSSSSEQARPPCVEC